MSAPGPSSYFQNSLRGNLLRQMADLAADAIFALDSQGNILLWNKGAEKLYGWTQQEVLGKCAHEILHTILPLPLDNLLRTIVKLGEWRGELTHTTRAGQVVQVDSRWQPYYADDQRLLGTFQVNRDLSGEQGVRQRLRLQAAALEAAANAIVITDSCGNIVWANPAFTTLTGYTLDEARGRNPRMLKSGQHGPELYDGLWQTIRSGRVWNGEITNRAKDGHLYTEQMTIAPVLSPDGQVSHFVAIKQDVTPRKTAEAALVRAEEKYREIYENAVVGIFQTTLDGRYLSVNRELARMFGDESPEQRMQITDIAHEVYVDCTRRRDFLREIEAKGVLRNFEYEVYRRDGSRAWFSENCRAVRNAQGQTLYFEGTVEDISERKSLELQLQRAQKLEAVGRLAGGVAHDFNNILGVIMGYADVARSRLAHDAAAANDLLQIKTAADRAASLTRQLLAFSRQQVIYPRNLDLGKVVEGMAEMLRRLVGEDVTISLHCDSPLGTVKADLGQIEQVLMNLAVNSRDAMPQGGEIRIAVANADLDADYCQHHPVVQPGHYVVISLSDNGCGMDAAIQARIFEPFFTTKDIGKGTGLGLSTVYGIVKQSGGFIWVYSEVGRGTTFKVYLPCISAQAEAFVPPVPTKPVPGGTETILLVEDDLLLRDLTVRFLQDAGYIVLLAARPEQAVQVAAEADAQIDLLLTDFVMPGMNGVELAGHIGSLRPNLKLLVMSGYASDQMAQRGDWRPGSHFLEKPFSRNELLAQVYKALHDG